MKGKTSDSREARRLHREADRLFQVSAEACQQATRLRLQAQEIERKAGLPTDSHYSASTRHELTEWAWPDKPVSHLARKLRSKIF